MALIDLLEKKKLSGAGLDVFLNEPNVPLKLRQLSNVTLYPHIGSATHETRTKMGMLAVENLIAFFNQKPTEFHVNPGDVIYIPVPLEAILYSIGY